LSQGGQPVPRKYIYGNITSLYNCAWISSYFLFRICLYLFYTLL